MDDVVAYFDGHALEPLMSKLRPMTPDGLQFCLDNNSLLRQVMSLYVIVGGGGTVLYLALASFSYLLFFKIFKHKYYPEGDPQPFPGQVQLELKLAFRSIPTMAHLTVPFFLGEINGYSRLYDRIEDYGWPYLCVSLLAFIFWSDTLIYWIHRELHEVRWLYKHVHKPHHLWKVPTPYAAIAFHPVDGWMQSLPYHFFPYLFPMHKWLSLLAFVGVQMWTVIIHDGVHYTPFEFINGSAHHTFHHSKFNYNFGQFFTFWDKWCGTHMSPLWQYDAETKSWVPSKFNVENNNSQSPKLD